MRLGRRSQCATYDQGGEPVSPATKVLEIENGDARSWVFCRLLIEEVLAQFMSEAGWEFGHPAMMYNDPCECLSDPEVTLPHHSMQLSTRKVTTKLSTTTRPARESLIVSDMAENTNPVSEFNWRLITRCRSHTQASTSTYNTHPRVPASTRLHRVRPIPTERPYHKTVPSRR
jgi:hypothetical protein